ncbi:MAG: hypothetical protein LPK88_11435 [Alphaproteobacteria bacterium]|nr:hypothetical protein [Alphaproteobacteria bacterium]MDX5416910.1 hypothetical protein [Alphaproteobacteria bacterium]MDX5494308.1 hypothetical protein [Alphaproteobacteria bacterium]
MNNATPQRAPRPDLNLALAVLAAGTLVAIAIVVTALLGPGKSPRLFANPQGGIWVERSGTLYLCRARQQAPGACVNLADGAVIAYGDIGR